MICIHCHNDNPNHAQYCSQCGKPTIINARANGMDMNVAAVWIYVAYKLIVIFFYRVMSYLVMPLLTKRGDYSTITTFYETAAIIFLLMELIVFAVIIGIVKNTPTRIAVGVLAFVTIMFFILDKAIRFAY